MNFSRNQPQQPTQPFGDVGAVAAVVDVEVVLRRRRQDRRSSPSASLCVGIAAVVRQPLGRLDPRRVAAVGVAEVAIAVDDVLDAGTASEAESRGWPRGAPRSSTSVGRPPNVSPFVFDLVVQHDVERIGASRKLKSSGKSQRRVPSTVTERRTRPRPGPSPRRRSRRQVVGQNVSIGRAPPPR